MMPLAQSLGMHPFTWGIIMVLLLVLGLVTPPVALVLFAASDIAGLPMEKVFLSCIPLFCSVLVVVLLLNIFPELTLFLPRLFGFVT
jgi:TRAP-type C4-dicarboxylate transport system permease large subunit